jgi:hypothetical protein
VLTSHAIARWHAFALNSAARAALTTLPAELTT